MNRAQQEPVIVGNVYDKYGTRNPFARLLMRGFLDTVGSLFARIAPGSALEVGCGEGLLAQHLATTGPPPLRFVLCDIDIRRISPHVDRRFERQEASAYELPFADATFDLVICCEVLEHLRDPSRAIAEAARVARRAVLVSTPREPLWRLLNVARGSYLSAWGNTPGHVQHFSGRGLVRLASGFLDVVERRSPPPWTVLLGRPRRASNCAS
ncbi:MAG: class I SAM-dependent methyltransferase [Polyangiaceae bacterium]|jgi:ubiquinone/menaquinone biosynthesis C-methylase UbiE